MSLSLKSFDEKIADLKQKKLALEAKQAQHLSKYLSNEIGESFSPQLAACIVQDIWSKSQKEQKEKWLKAAKTFQFSTSRKAAKTDSKNTTPPQQNSKEKAQGYGEK